MTHRSLRECVLDLERNGQLLRIAVEIDGELEAAEIQRRVVARAGPALLFERLRGSRFPAVSNLFGTLERARFLFRDTIEIVRRAIELKADPAAALRAPLRYVRAPMAGWWSLPVEVGHAAVMAERTTIASLPHVRAWPMDGGSFITLPQVLSEHPDHPGPMHANLGMYRVQVSGNAYDARHIGMHYQIHRGIGVHHAAAVRRGERLRVSIFVGGPPAHTVAAVMPMPEGMSELVLAGMLAGRRFRYHRWNGHLIAADADFCIVGSIVPERLLPEGPFGDHLGYYSLQHDFPVMEVEAVFHRRDAIWPFTVVGRPPQEDTTFGALIHELTAPMVPVNVPGLVAMHAVDEAGVHPLLLALGSERYVPYRPRQPQELLTIANAVLGFNQASLAKYLWIAAHEDDVELGVDDVARFLCHVLARFDATRDLHFQTKTTIDTLDYSGTGLNAGSKLVIAAAGSVRRTLGNALPRDVSLPAGFAGVGIALPGVLVVQGPAFATSSGSSDMQRLVAALEHADDGALATAETPWPLVVVVDDVEFVQRTLANWLWVTFTRSNPSHDVHGVRAFVEHKHWGCHGALVIDARIKPHHAPAVESDPAIVRRVDALGVRGGPLYGFV